MQNNDSVKGCSGGVAQGGRVPLLKFSKKAEGLSPPSLFVLGYSKDSYNAKKAVKNCYFTKGQPLTTKHERKRDASQALYARECTQSLKYIHLVAVLFRQLFFCCI